MLKYLYTKVHLIRLEPQENCKNFANTHGFPDFKDQQTHDAPDVLLALFLKKSGSSTPNLTVCPPIRKYTTFHPALIDQMECRHNFLFLGKFSIKREGEMKSCSPSLLPIAARAWILLSLGWTLSYRTSGFPSFTSLCKAKVWK